MIKQPQEYAVEIELVKRRWFKTTCQRTISVIEATSAEYAVNEIELLLEMTKRALGNRVMAYVVGVEKIS
jgi:hypothetical protein